MESPAHDRTSHPERTLTAAELIADGVVHAVGIVVAIAAGSALLAAAASRTGPGEYAAAIF